MKQLTIRGFDKDLERAIRELAATKQISWNKAVLRLLRRGAGLDHAQADGDVVGNSLDRFAGTWSSEETREFAQAVRGFERIQRSQSVLISSVVAGELLAGFDGHFGWIDGIAWVDLR